MTVLMEVRWLIRLVGGRRIRSGHYAPAPMTVTRNEHRELARTMRMLPGRFTDRLPARTLQQITGAAAAGQWEKAVDRLITALRDGAEPITVGERDELRAVLTAMNMPGDRVNELNLRS